MTRTFARRFLLACTAALLFASAANAQSVSAQDTCKHTVTGNLQILKFDSKVFGTPHTLRVLLPEGYTAPANKDRKYPVLVMLDAQNVFDACTAYDHQHEWEVDETVARLTKEGKIEPLIIVGVDHAAELRAHEFLPWKDSIQNPGMDEPAGKRYPEFLIKEVLPLVAEKYRVDTKTPGRLGIAGSSYGGVAALYASFVAPTMFSKVIAESPIVWVGNGELMRAANPLPIAPDRVFMAFGGKEHDGPDKTVGESIVRLIRQMESNLKNAVLKPATVQVVIDPEAEHNEQAWAKRFPEAITFLFPAEPKSGTSK